MLAYAQAYDAQRLILIYPWHEEMGEPGLCRRWVVPDSDRFLDIAIVNIGRIETVANTLHELFKGDVPSPAHLS